MKQTKEIDWSYPTSTNAKRLGFYDSGCWTVTVRSGMKGKAVFGSPSKDAAIAHARTLPMPFGSLWTQYEASEGARRIKDAYVRHYSDNGQTKAYVEWADNSRTEGEPTNGHMLALMTRFVREGGTIREERW